MRDKTQTVTTADSGEIEVAILPLPWPAPGADLRATRRPHRHRCVNCPSYYLCDGPDDTGECVPLCGPCLWVELGEQLKMYRSMADAIDRRRRKVEERVGSSACRRARMHRRKLLRQSRVVAGFGRVVLQREDSGSEATD